MLMRSCAQEIRYSREIFILFFCLFVSFFFLIFLKFYFIFKLYKIKYVYT